MGLCVLIKDQVLKVYFGIIRLAHHCPSLTKHYLTVYDLWEGNIPQLVDLLMQNMKREDICPLFLFIF